MYLQTLHFNMMLNLFIVILLACLTLLLAETSKFHLIDVKAGKEYTLKPEDKKASLKFGPKSEVIQLLYAFTGPICDGKYRAVICNDTCMDFKTYHSIDVCF
jgi:hypothetical protein